MRVWRSIRARLLGLLLIGGAGVWLAAAAVTWLDLNHELDELLDAHLAQAAALLVVQQAGDFEGEDDRTLDAPSLHRYAPRAVFQVFHEGQMVLRSADAPAHPLVALAAAGMGAESVTAFDISASAVRCARANIAADGAEVTVRLGSWTRALECDPFDVVLCNPPYVPVTAEADEPAPPDWAGPRQAWDGGEDGRRVLDPLCAAAPALLHRGGTLLLVQSEFADVTRTLNTLQDNGLQARVVARQRIPFGPVLHRRAEWLEQLGLLRPGRRTETLAVVAARRR